MTKLDKIAIVLFIIGVELSILKITGVITWSWWVINLPLVIISSPIWGTALVFLGLCLLYVLLGVYFGLGELFSNNKKRKITIKHLSKISPLYDSHISEGDVPGDNIVGAYNLPRLNPTLHINNNVKGIFLTESEGSPGVYVLSKVSRVEVTVPYGRAYVSRSDSNQVRLYFQDDGKTLKIFIDEKTQT